VHDVAHAIRYICRTWLADTELRSCAGVTVAAALSAVAASKGEAEEAC
jgi:hypothetical protein